MYASASSNPARKMYPLKWCSGFFHLSSPLAIISRVKVMADMDISERRNPQDGRFRVILDKRPIDVRVSSLPTIHGEKLVLRLLDRKSMRIDIRNVGPQYVGPALRSDEDMWGVRRKAVSYGTGSYDEIDHYPLAGATSVDDLNAHRWPSTASA